MSIKRPMSSAHLRSHLVELRILENDIWEHAFALNGLARQTSRWTWTDRSESVYQMAFFDVSLDTFISSLQLHPEIMDTNMYRSLLQRGVGPPINKWLNIQIRLPRTGSWISYRRQHQTKPVVTCDYFDENYETRSYTGRAGDPWYSQVTGVGLIHF